MDSGRAEAHGGANPDRGWSGTARRPVNARHSQAGQNELEIGHGWEAGNGGAGRGTSGETPTGRWHGVDRTRPVARPLRRPPPRAVCLLPLGACRDREDRRAARADQPGPPLLRLQPRRAVRQARRLVPRVGPGRRAAPPHRRLQRVGPLRPTRWSATSSASGASSSPTTSTPTGSRTAATSRSTSSPERRSDGPHPRLHPPRRPGARHQRTSPASTGSRPSRTHFATAHRG